MTELQPLDGSVLAAGIRARFVERVNGLRVNILEAGEPGRPCLLLLHGFPELAYSWRKSMGPLAAAGYHVVAPDLRGYGRTTGWSTNYDDDLYPFRHLIETSATAAADGPRVLPRPCRCCGGRMIIIETFARGCQPKHRPAPAAAAIRIDTS
jgi:hypothetical protein